MSLSRDKIELNIHQAIIKLFEIDETELTGSANLYDDLDIDSIDTIDLLIELKKAVGKDIDPAAFKNARTIDDVIDVIITL